MSTAYSQIIANILILEIYSFKRTSFTGACHIIIFTLIFGIKGALRINSTHKIFKCSCPTQLITTPTSLWLWLIDSKIGGTYRPLGHGNKNPNQDSRLKLNIWLKFHWSKITMKTKPKYYKSTVSLSLAIESSVELILNIISRSKLDVSQYQRKSCVTVINFLKCWLTIVKL